MKRTYDSTLRAKAKQDTRDRILDAMVEVVTKDGVHAFSVQNVASAAGVALRTVYRHFQTREALLDGLDELIERRGAELGITTPVPASVKDLPATVGDIYQSFERTRDAMRAYVVISIALGRRVPSFDRRTRAIHASLLESFPGLAPAEAKAATAIIRMLGSTRTWFLLTTELEMTTGAAAGAASWAIDALLADLAKRTTKRKR